MAPPWVSFVFCFFLFLFLLFLRLLWGSDHFSSSFMAAITSGLTVGSLNCLRGSGVDLSADSGGVWVLSSRTTFLGDLHGDITDRGDSTRNARCNNRCSSWAFLGPAAPTVPPWCHPWWGGTCFSSSYKSSPFSSKCPSPLADSINPFRWYFYRDIAVIIKPCIEICLFVTFWKIDISLKAFGYGIVYLLDF